MESTHVLEASKECIQLVETSVEYAGVRSQYRVKVGVRNHSRITEV